MANEVVIPIRSIDATGTPTSDSQIVADNGVTMFRATVGSMADAVRPVASMSDAVAGTDNAKVMTSARVKESIASEAGVTIATSSQGNLADSAVQPGRSISTGAGLTGGGNLSANRTISLDSASIASLAKADTAVQPSRQMTAGSGLIGGGSLAADRSISLSAASSASLVKAENAVLFTTQSLTSPQQTLVRSQIGLGSVDNTSDAAKPISTATQSALNAKANASINVTAGTGLTGGGDLTANRTVSLNAASISSLVKADTAVQATGTAAQYIRGDGTFGAAVTSVSGRTGAVTLVKADVGLGNVDNTTDAAKPVSIATQTALNLKANSSVAISGAGGLSGGGDLTNSRVISLSAGSSASLALADSAVQPTRTVSSGAGLAGGGALSANQTISLNSASIASLAKADSAVQPNISITAGTGLSGGGTLAASRSLALSAASIASLAKADTAVQPGGSGSIPTGGASGQILAKLSSTDYDVGYITSTAATAVSYVAQTLTAPQKTQAQTNIGGGAAGRAVFTATDAAAAWAALGGNQSFATNGYAVFPNGLILQWGSIPSGLHDIGITFPTAFPTAALSVTVSSVLDVSGTSLVVTHLDQITKTGFVIRRRTANSSGISAWGEYVVQWIALGY